MESLFKWMADLGTAEGMKYFIILAVILALIPYSSLILISLKQIVLKKDLSIIFFEYSANQHVYAGKDENGNDLFIDLPEDDILLSGTRLKLYWKVEGAIKIDIEPIGTGLKGNCAEVLIDSSILKYTLTAHGLWGKKLTTELIIPIDKIYHLDTTKISTYTNHIVRPVPAINTIPISESRILINAYAQGTIKKMNNWFRVNLLRSSTSKINPEKLVHANTTRKNLYRNIDDARIMKGYTFSTKKYQTIKLSNSSN